MNEKTKKFIQAKGRRKTSIARIRLFSGKGEISINDMKAETYFSDIAGASQKIKAVIKKAGLDDKINASFKVSGGGKNSQINAVVHCLARALLIRDPKLRKTFRDEGYLTRDPRIKRARRAPQWQKR
jgi:small subunit ribosomal protein S9